jgi:hypothetical protein
VTGSRTLPNWKKYKLCIVGSVVAVLDPPFIISIKSALQRNLGLISVEGSALLALKLLSTFLFCFTLPHCEIGRSPSIMSLESIAKAEAGGSHVHETLEKSGSITMPDVYGAAKTDGNRDAAPAYEYDRLAERKLRNKIDLMIMPTTCLLYLFCFIDRANIGKLPEPPTRVLGRT